MKNIRKYENFHIALWLLKDTCWVTDFKTGGIVMIVPTLAVAFYITWKMRIHTAELFHNLAVCSWICANSIWMVGEFFFNDGLRQPATIFFSLGLIFIGWYYFVLLPRENKRIKAIALKRQEQMRKSDSATDSFLS